MHGSGGPLRFLEFLRSVLLWLTNATTALTMAVVAHRPLSRRNV